MERLRGILRNRSASPPSKNPGIAKNRHGPVGTITAYFDLETQRILPAELVKLEAIAYDR